ncbi:MAG: hypothetical protein H7343_16370 [Undibacterium sp.]|nr:hypothetical protein [Opitutaceae bacterium]
MPDRLAELQRQRALVQQDLARLDREIAEAQSRVDHSPTPETPHTRAVPALAITLPADADADAILNQYRSGEASVKTDVRKGCILYAVLAFAALILGVFSLYFMLRH